MASSMKFLCIILAFCGLCFAQTNTAFAPFPRLQFVDANGSPLSGGFVYTYQAGTSIPLATYHLDTLGNITPNQNPTILDSSGTAEVRLLPQSYKFVLQDANHVQIWAIDQVADAGQLLSTQVVLLNPPGAALQTIAGPLAFTTLSLNSGTPLTTTNQSGTGNLCMTIGCSLVTPIVNGVQMANSPGTYISVPNASTTGTTLNTLTKFATAAPAWVKKNDQSGSGTGSPQVTSAFSTSLSNPSLIVVYTSGAVGTFTINDTAGNTYLDCGTGQVVFNASAKGVQCFYALNTQNTASDVISFASTGGGVMTVIAQEWTGAAISTPVDVTQSSGANADTGSGGGQNVATKVANTNGADLVVGFAGVTAGSLTAGTGFTASSNVALEYLTQGSASSIAATWNDNTNSDSYAALLVAFRPFPGTSALAVIAGSADSGKIQGITVSGAGTSGNSIIQQSGISPCVFDGPTSAGDYVQPSTITVGDCHDNGATIASVATQNMGQVLSTNAVAGTYQIVLAGIANGLSSKNVICSDAVAVTVNANTASQQSVKTCKIPAGLLNVVGKSFRMTFDNVVHIGVGGSVAAEALFQMGATQFGGIAVQTAQDIGSGAEVTCTVTVPGSSGTIVCMPLAQATINSGAFPTSLFMGPRVLTFGLLDLTSPLTVGSACQIFSASSSNTCTGNLLIVEQLN